jgi:predicted permease
MRFRAVAGFDRDVRYGVRQLTAQRGSSVVAALTLALGIGASTAIFSVIDATILRPLPYPEPEQLVSIGVEIPRSEGRVSRPTVSLDDVRLWQKADDIFSAVAGWGSAFRGRIAGGPEPERVRVLYFTETYLPIHGVTPFIGRGFAQAETQFAAPAVALLGYGYWQRRYGGQRDVLGETIRLDDGSATIVGVLPAWFHPDVPVFQPLQVPPEMAPRRGTGRVSAYARLRPGVSIEQAQTRLSAMMAGEPQPDGSVAPVRVRVTSRLDAEIRRSQTTVTVISAAVCLILLIACVNVAGLLLARGTVRQREIAVRAALGAGRGRLIRQLLSESVVLAVVGGVVGVFLAWLALDVIVANLPLSLPTNAPATLNWRVLGATAALLVLTVLLFGLVPAIRLSRVGIRFALVRGSQQSGSILSRRAGGRLIAAEVALATVLFACSGLMLRSVARLHAVDLGFNPEGLITMKVLPLDRRPAAHKAYYRALVERFELLPGVESVGLVDNFPLADGGSYTGLRGTGAPMGSSVFQVLPGYFEAIQARLQAGRLLAEADYTSGFRGVVVSQSAARELFPDGVAVGRQLARAGGSDRDPWTVVGVIGDLRHGGPLADRETQDVVQVFFPLEPDESDLNQAMNVVVRASSSMRGLSDLLRREALTVGPPALVERTLTGSERFQNSVTTPRRRMMLLTLLGGLGVTLALVGIFGMTGYTVARRTAEVGVRLAFGAGSGQVVGMMVRDAAVPILVGTSLGLGCATLATRVISSFLFETAPTDPLTFGLVGLTLTVAGCLAALVPAYRAASVDPVATLRAE